MKIIKAYRVFSHKINSNEAGGRGIKKLTFLDTKVRLTSNHVGNLLPKVFIRK